MKSMNKVILFIFTCLTLTNAVNCFYYGDDPGANMLGGAATGALIGGAVRGGRGAAVGAGVGLGLGAISSAAASSRRRRYDDDYESRSSRKSRKKQRRLEDENADLRARLQQYENGQY